MANDVKRLNYFKGQFLRENDFLDDQTYHVQHQRDHARLLHTPGIASGLDVSFVPGATAVTVAPGVGYDTLGRRIALVDPFVLELSTFSASATVFVAITYDEQPSDPTSETGITGSTRVTEKPIVAGLTSAPSAPSLLLGVVSRTSTTVTSVDPTGRSNAGVKGGDLVVSSLTVSSSSLAPAQWPSVRTTGALQATLTGNLQVNGTLGATTLAPSVVNNAAIANLAVTTGKLADASVTTIKILDANVTTQKLADVSVVTAKIADANVTTLKLADNSVVTTKILDGAVVNAKLADTSVTTQKIADNSVITAKILDANVVNSKLAAAAVTEPKIADLSISTRVLQDSSVTAAKIADGTVGTAELAPLAVTTAKLADANVTNAKIADASITAPKVVNGSLAFNKLSMNLVLDVSSQTIPASSSAQVTAFSTAQNGPNSGGIVFVDTWGLSTSANYSWSLVSLTAATGSPPNVQTVVVFKNNAPTAVNIAFKVWLFNPQ